MHQNFESTKTARRNLELECTLAPTHLKKRGKFAKNYIKKFYNLYDRYMCCTLWYTKRKKEMTLRPYIMWVWCSYTVQYTVNAIKFIMFICAISLHLTRERERERERERDLHHTFSRESSKVNKIKSFHIRNTPRSRVAYCIII